VSWRVVLGERPHGGELVVALGYPPEPHFADGQIRKRDEFLEVHRDRSLLQRGGDPIGGRGLLLPGDAQPLVGVAAGAPVGVMSQRTRAKSITSHFPRRRIRIQKPSFPLPR
jgi:hypothetical protein